MLTKAAFIWSKWQKNINIVKYCYNLNYIFYLNTFYNVLDSFDAKAEFPAGISVYRVTWEINSSEIILICWFAARETFLLIIIIIIYSLIF